LERPVVRDIGISAAFVLFAAWLTHGLWPHPSTRALALNHTDQALNEWWLAHGTRLYAGEFRLLTYLINVPDGVNVMANASCMLLGFIMAPVTLAFGAPVSFALVIAGNLAGTAIGWYLLLTRTLKLHRLAAFTGAALCGFAPGIVSQNNAHIHVSAQWLVPAIVWCVLRLVRQGEQGGWSVRRPVETLRIGALLGALITLHVFLGEEVLFLTAVSLAVFCVCYAIFAPGEIVRLGPPLAAGVLVAGTIGTGLLAYFLWMQFSGPQHVPNGPFAPAFFSADLAGFLAISPMSLAGGEGAAKLASGPAEYNTFFGFPLLAAVTGSTLWLWRRPAVLALSLTGLAMCLFALGPRVIINGERTEQAGPYVLLEGLPIVEGALPTRFALAAVPAFAVVLAIAVHAALTASESLRILVPVTVLATLAPIVPAPLPTTERAPVPVYFTEGYWRSCAPEGGVLVPVPLPTPEQPDTMRWAAAANAEFAFPQGNFIGPYAAGGKASLGIFPRPTSQLLAKVAKTGVRPEVGDNERVQAAEDVAYWRASCLVVMDQPHTEAVKSTMDDLFGPGQKVADVWTWQVDPVLGN
jgi:hypothetical protein